MGLVPALVFAAVPVPVDSVAVSVVKPVVEPVDS